MLAKRRDSALENRVDALIDRMVARLDSRNANPEAAIRTSGTFLEAAVEYYRATGKRAALDAAVRAADAMAAVYGPGRKTYISGHEGLKIGLVSLYRETGDARYRDLARFFLDERGRDDYPRQGEYALDRTYAQDHAAGRHGRPRPSATPFAPPTSTSRWPTSRRSPARPRSPARARLDLGGRGSPQDLRHRRHRVDPLPRAVRRAVRAPQPQRLERDLRLLRQRRLEPPHVPAPRRREVPRPAGARALQRLPRRRVAEGRSLLLPEPADVVRQLRALRLDQHAVLPAQRGPPDRVARALHLRHGRRRRSTSTCSSAAGPRPPSTRRSSCCDRRRAIRGTAR